MVENILGKVLRVRLKVNLPLAYEATWQAKFGSENGEAQYAPVFCGTLQSIDKSMNLVLENVHIGAIKCSSDEESSNPEKVYNEAQIATFQSLFIRGSTIRYAEIVG